MLIMSSPHGVPRGPVRTNLARLACSHAEQPYVVPISFAYDGESNCLFSFSAIGKKVQWMRENPKVCVEVEDVADRFHGRDRDLRAV